MYTPKKFILIFLEILSRDFPKAIYVGLSKIILIISESPTPPVDSSGNSDGYSTVGILIGMLIGILSILLSWYWCKKKDCHMI